MDLGYLRTLGTGGTHTWGGSPGGGTAAQMPVVSANVHTGPHSRASLWLSHIQLSGHGSPMGRRWLNMVSSVPASMKALGDGHRVRAVGVKQELWRYRQPMGGASVWLQIFTPIIGF